MPGFALRRRGVLAAAGALVAAVALSPLDAMPADAAAKGMFKVVCQYSHSLHDDPIVYPARPGAAHFHDFFGSTKTNAHTTLSTLRSGATTCGNLKDKSAYWAPVLYQDGKRIVPKVVQVYYRASHKNPGAIKTIPLGLKMIAGDHMATSPQSVDVAAWTCIASPPNFQATMQTCSSSQKLRNRIRFPECWDGRHLDSADHKSHMAYLNRGSCPASHPVAIPRVDIEVHYGYIPGGPSRVTLSSGSWTSLHGDFWNAWDPATLQSLVNRCLVGTQICGTV